MGAGRGVHVSRYVITFVLDADGTMPSFGRMSVCLPVCLSALREKSFFVPLILRYTLDRDTERS